MIKGLQICDSKGFPIYTRTANNFTGINGTLMSGLISAIGVMGKELFKQNIANITFGEGSNTSYLTIIRKELFKENKSIDFVYFSEQKCDLASLNNISTTIFIDSKRDLIDSSKVRDDLKPRINKIIDLNFLEIFQD
ncbi:hypothetical protein NEF87_003854 [Candidatus Lokiarchaeum ossiferum]|uniref:Carbohydrate kinase PfkB domain-containing protein n=1 Tax=Candidatus Lokiarchaeum ossiferum TaxID=2951803 RepID=A0ABY6HYE1_9ARCH|nr:hypothetical protein NEF87_003854 [Candidatus Lokiarchaeum sp. B-35]